MSETALQLTLRFAAEGRRVRPSERRAAGAKNPRSPKDNTTQHTLMVDKIRLRLGRVPDVKLWPNPVKLLDAIASDGRVFKIRTGLALGSSDLVGILRPDGRWFCLEVKTGEGTSKPHQLMWHELIRSMGGFVAEVDSEEAAIAALARARLGASE